MAITVPPVDVVAALIKGVTWGTPVDADVTTKRIPIQTESIEEQVVRAPDMGYAGVASQRYEIPGTIAAAGSIEGFLDFDNWDLATALVFGTAGAPVQVGGTAAYTNTYNLIARAYGLFGSLAIEKNVDLVEYGSVKIFGMHIRGQAGQPWRVSYDLMADKKLFDTSSSYGATADVLTTTTYQKSPPPLAVWNTAANNVFRLNLNSGGALASGDNIYPESFELNIVRSMRSIFTSRNVPYQDEPADNGFIEIGGSFTLPLYEAITYEEYHLAGTRLKMSIALLGDIIAAANAYQFTINIPQLQITSAPTRISGPETVQHPISFRASVAASNPTGMSDTETYIDIQNTRTASPLA